jgi:peptide deformylase
VGLSLRLVVIDAGDRNPFVLIDPQVLDRDDHQELAMEGCLSIPGWRGAVARSLGIKVSTRTISGDATTLEFTGYMARVVQHELDHLDGVLFTERMDPDAQLVPTDAVDVANDLIKDLRRDEAQESRRSADRSNRSANKQKGGKRRRR